MEEFYKLNNGDIFIRISRDADIEDPKKIYYRIFVLKLYQKIKTSWDKSENGKIISEKDSFIYESKCYLGEEEELCEKRWKYIQDFSTSDPFCLGIDFVFDEACGDLNCIDYLYFIVKDEEDILWSNAKNNFPNIDSNNLTDFEDIKLFIKQFTRDFILDVCLDSLN